MQPNEHHRRCSRSMPHIEEQRELKMLACKAQQFGIVGAGRKGPFRGMPERLTEIAVLVDTTILYSTS